MARTNRPYDDTGILEYLHSKHGLQIGETRPDDIEVRFERPVGNGIDVAEATLVLKLRMEASEARRMLDLSEVG